MEQKMTGITEEQQQRKLKSMLDGFYASHLISIGVECGLFEAIHKKDGITYLDLAAELGLHEPYIEIWCHTAYHFELLDLDNEGKYVLQPFLDEFLADRNGLKSMAARFRLFVNVAGDRLKQYPGYYKSGGIAEEYSDERSRLCAAASDTGHQAILFYFSILPDEDRLKKKLAQPFKLLDIGCGSGGFIIKMAQAYRHGQLWGHDPILHGIDTANEQIKKLGLEGRVSVVKSGGEETDYREEYDIVSLFITFHELLLHVKQKVMEKAYQSLKQDGLLLIVDFAYPGRIEDFRNSEYAPGVLDQFTETTLGIRHLAAEKQEEMFEKIGFKALQRTSMQGMDIITALK